jgi:hypothetical protein
VSQILVHHRVNPLLSTATLFEKVTRSEPRYLYIAWRAFADYITFKYLTKGLKGEEYYEREYRYLLAKDSAERVSRYIKSRLQKHISLRSTPSDDLVEAAILIYFILASEGIEKGFSQVLSEALKLCLEDANIISLKSSQALSRCLGLAYVILYKNDQLENLRSQCLNKEGSREYKLFCTYSTFAKALSMLLRNEENYVNDVEAWMDMVTEVTWLPPELIALNMVSLGLLTVITGKDEVDKKMRLFEMLNKVLQVENAPGKLQKHIWTSIQLAIVINKLDKVAYVPADHVAIPKSLANNLQNIIESISNPILYALGLLFSIILTIAGIYQNSVSLLSISTIALDSILVYLIIKTMQYQETLSKIKVVLGSKDELD